MQHTIFHEIEATIILLIKRHVEKPKAQQAASQAQIDFLNKTNQIFLQRYKAIKNQGLDLNLPGNLAIAIKTAEEFRNLLAALCLVLDHEEGKSQRFNKVQKLLEETIAFAKKLNLVKTKQTMAAKSTKAHQAA